MDCQICRDAIIDIIEKGILVDIFPEVKAHLQVCPFCQSEFGETKNLFEMMTNDRHREIDDPRLDGITIDINRRVDAASAKAFRFNPKFALSLITALAASILLVVWGGINTGVKSPNDYYMGIDDNLSVQELLDSAVIASDLKSALYQQYDIGSLEELEDYFIENANYQMMMTDLDESEIEYIRLRIGEEMNIVS